MRVPCLVAILVLVAPASAAELPRGKTILVDRQGQCTNAPEAATQTKMGGELRFYLGDGRVYESFSADSAKALAYVPDGREHIVQSRELNTRYPVTTQATWDGKMLVVSYRYKLDGLAFNTTRRGTYRVEIDVAANQCRLDSDKLTWRQSRKDGSVFRDAKCEATTSTCTIVDGRK